MPVRNNYDFVPRKVHDKTVDTLKRRIQDRHNEIQKIRARLEVLEEAVRQIYLALGAPVQPPKFRRLD